MVTVPARRSLSKCVSSCSLNRFPIRLLLRPSYLNPSGGLFLESLLIKILISVSPFAFVSRSHLCYFPESASTPIRAVNSLLPNRRVHLPLPTRCYFPRSAAGTKPRAHLPLPNYKSRSSTLQHSCVDSPRSAASTNPRAHLPLPNNPNNCRRKLLSSHLVCQSKGI